MTFYSQKTCCSSVAKSQHHHCTFHVHGKLHLFFSSLRNILISWGIYGSNLKLTLFCKGGWFMGISNSTFFLLVSFMTFFPELQNWHWFRTEPHHLLHLCFIGKLLGKLYLILLNLQRANAVRFLFQAAKVCCGYKSSNYFNGPLDRTSVVFI